MNSIIKFLMPDRRIKTEDGDISIFTTYSGFPRNTTLPANYVMPHKMYEQFIKKVRLDEICRGGGLTTHARESYENDSKPMILKVLMDWKLNKVIGLTIAHLDGKDLHIDLLCAMERNKNVIPRKKGFGSILMKEIKKEAVRFNAKYLTLESVPGAYNFYTEKMGFKKRPRSEYLQWKVPRKNSNAGKKLLPEGSPKGSGSTPARTSGNTARLQRALRNLNVPIKTAKVVSKSPQRPPILPSISAKTTASSERIQRALTTTKKSPSPKKLPPLRSSTKSPSSRKLTPKSK